MQWAGLPHVVLCHGTGSISQGVVWMTLSTAWRLVSKGKSNRLGLEGRDPFFGKWRRWICGVLAGNGDNSLGLRLVLQTTSSIFLRKSLRCLKTTLTDACLSTQEPSQWLTGELQAWLGHLLTANRRVVSGPLLGHPLWCSPSAH